ncbi:hypothetical protein CAPTEDRAFT_203092 [Capitella teleta]|uniref:Endonuclease/exonuclease/phosphatase domain-containing protein n=1 Tax=Capitella teleta TaxID=283909 RepID=R7V5D0_CAPTE|nr:hypothetical protein CAPTEDRAFT_203092 [Capitella teleta]|eukprot:ELU10995.1 hypothetical protein CAPTEDRAFT_203092 [Capitella teleta]
MREVTRTEKYVRGTGFFDEAGFEESEQSVMRGLYVSQGTLKRRLRSTNVLKSSLGIAADRPTKRGTKGFGRGAIPVWISGSPGHSAKPTVNKARGSNPCNLISIPRAPRQTSHHRQFTIGLLNARSAKQNDQNADKPREIYDLIVDRGLDSLVITETWLREGNVDNIAVGDMTPNGFSCKHIPRSTPKRGGGLALIHASSIATKPLRKILYNSFECFITSLTVRNTSICVVAVYRPPNCLQPAFLSNFSDLFGNVIAEFSNIVIMGDFNINVASPSPYADRLKTILYDFNFQKHVTDATHVNDHTIDLIMSLTHEHHQGDRCRQKTVGFTYNNKATGVQSVLDHFIVTENLFGSIESYSCLHEGDNLSDYLPVCLILDVKASFAPRSNAYALNHPSWQKATVQDKAAYRLRLKELLREVDISFDVFSCRSFECVCEDHRRMIEQYYSDVMSAMIMASKECIPSWSKKKAAGWSTYKCILKSDLNISLVLFVLLTYLYNFCLALPAFGTNVF